MRTLGTLLMYFAVLIGLVLSPIQFQCLASCLSQLLCKSSQTLWHQDSYIALSYIPAILTSVLLWGVYIHTPLSLWLLGELSCSPQAHYSPTSKALSPSFVLVPSNQITDRPVMNFLQVLPGLDVY